MKVIHIAITLLMAFKALAQADSVAFTIESKMPDGVYPSYESFRHNNPVTVAQITSPLDKEQINFLEKNMQQEKLSYTKNDIAYTMPVKKVWGFFQNNTLYVNYGGEFYRVPVFGAISYLVATVTVLNSGFYDPRFGYSIGGGYTKETREFLIDFYDGIVSELSLERAEQLLGRDKTLSAEFNDLSRRKRKEQLYKFIRRYNGLHPVYFLK